MSIDLLELLLTIVSTILASSGFWFFVMKKMDTNNLNKKLLMGLARDRVVYLSLKYIERGEITQSEHENLYNYLYEPFKELGGNGAIEKLMKEVDKLPISKAEIYIEYKRRTKHEIVKSDV